MSSPHPAPVSSDGVGGKGAFAVGVGEAASSEHPDSFADAFLFEEGISADTDADPNDNTSTAPGKPTSTYDESDPGDQVESCCYTPYQQLVVLSSASASFVTVQRERGGGCGDCCSLFGDETEENAVPYSEIGCITLLQNVEGLPTIYTDSDLTPFACSELDSGAEVWQRIPLILTNETLAWQLIEDLKDRMSAKGLQCAKAIYTSSHIADQTQAHPLKAYLRVRAQILQQNQTKPYVQPGPGVHPAYSTSPVPSANARGGALVGGRRPSANGVADIVVSRPIGGGDGRKSSQYAASATVKALVAQQPRLPAALTAKQEVAGRIRELRSSMHQGVISEIDYERAKTIVARQALSSSWGSPSIQLGKGITASTAPAVGRDPRTISSVFVDCQDPRSIHSLGTESTGFTRTGLKSLEVSTLI